MGDAEFAERFNSVVSIVEKQGGQFSEMGLITQKMSTDDTDTTDVTAMTTLSAAETAGASSVKACLFVNNLNYNTHGEYKRSLVNVYSDGIDHYRGDVSEALS